MNINNYNLFYCNKEKSIHRLCNFQQDCDIYIWDLNFL